MNGYDFHLSLSLSIYPCPSIMHHVLHHDPSQEQSLSLQGEEARRTISHLAEEERVTAQHKAEVENSLQGEHLKLWEVKVVNDYSF